MLLPLAVAIAGFFGYRSYKRTGHIPLLGGPRPPPPPPDERFASAGEFAPATDAHPLIIDAPVTVKARAAIPTAAQPSIVQKLATMTPASFTFSPKPKV